MGLFDMFSGKSARRQMIAMMMEQQKLQQTLIENENKNAEASRRQFEMEQARMDQQIATERAQNKRLALDDAVNRLGGFTGFRSLLSGRRGGGGFGPRSMLDAA